MRPFGCILTCSDSPGAGPGPAASGNLLRIARCPGSVRETSSGGLSLPVCGRGCDLPDSPMFADVAAVQDCAAFIGRVADELTAEVRGLEREVTAMVSGGWSGSAATACDRAWGK